MAGHARHCRSIATTQRSGGLHKKSEIPRTAVRGLFRSNLLERGLKSIRIPPTAVGGLFSPTFQSAAMTENPTSLKVL